MPTSALLLLLLSCCTSAEASSSTPWTRLFNKVAQSPMVTDLRSKLQGSSGAAGAAGGSEAGAADSVSQPVDLRQLLHRTPSGVAGEERASEDARARARTAAWARGHI